MVPRKENSTCKGPEAGISCRRTRRPLWLVQNKSVAEDESGLRDAGQIRPNWERESSLHYILCVQRSAWRNLRRQNPQETEMVSGHKGIS